MKNALIIDNRYKANVIKQGDETPLTFKLVPISKPSLALVDKPARVVLYDDDKIHFETDTVVDKDHSVTFVIDSIIDVGEYTLEIIVDGVHKFPSDNSTTITITQSSDGALVAEVESYGVEAVVKDVLDRLSDGLELDGLATLEEVTDMIASIDHVTQEEIDDLKRRLVDELEDIDLSDYVTNERLETVREALIGRMDDIDLSEYVTNEQMDQYKSSVRSELEAIMDEIKDHLATEVAGEQLTKEDVLEMLAEVDLTGYATKGDLDEHDGWLYEHTMEVKDELMGYIDRISLGIQSPLELSVHKNVLKLKYGYTSGSINLGDFFATKDDLNHLDFVTEDKVNNYINQLTFQNNNLQHQIYELKNQLNSLQK